MIRLVGMILAEQDDEWQDDRRYFRPGTLALIDPDPEVEEVVPDAHGELTDRARGCVAPALHHVLGLDRAEITGLAMVK